jgi:hypothetical protein
VLRHQPAAGRQNHPDRKPDRASTHCTDIHVALPFGLRNRL